jgi:hypothetical protein
LSSLFGQSAGGNSLPGIRDESDQVFLMSSARGRIISFLLALMMLGTSTGSSPSEKITCTDACPVCDPCPTIASLFPHSPIWIILSYFLTSCEVLLRSFTLGFGLRMLAFVFMEYQPAPPGGGDGGGGGNLLQDVNIRRNIQVAMLTGVALASAVFGSSLFIPVNFRMRWFNYNDY